MFLKNITAESITVIGTDGKVTCANAYSPDMNITSENGDIDLTVSEENGYSLSFDTEKGKLKAYFESSNGSYQCGDGKYSFKVKTYGGNLNVSLSDI